MIAHVLCKTTAVVVYMKMTSTLTIWQSIVLVLKGMMNN